MADTLQFIANNADTQNAIAIIQAIFVLIGALLTFATKGRKQ